MTAKFFALLLLIATLCSDAICSEKRAIQVGHFPNITHAQAMIGHQLTRQGKGWFEERLGPDVEVQWYVYQAGPSAMEAILTETIDLTYVGPNPAINAYIKSKGEEVRILCGACSGGAALVVQPDGRIKTDSDFKGKRIGTPQFGNTQDVAARFWLESIGLHVTMTGGDVLVIPTHPPDQLMLFQRKQLDGVWTVEPWVSKLVLEAKGQVYLEESSLWKETKGQYVTTHLASSKKFAEQHPDLAKQWVLAHVELTEWIKQNPIKAKELFNSEMKQETNLMLPAPILDRAWEHIELTWDPIPTSLFVSAKRAYQIGFLKEDPDLKGIYELRFLNEIMAKRK
jgi:sulfonate transport system substrate-binding protein